MLGVECPSELLEKYGGYPVTLVIAQGLQYEPISLARNIPLLEALFLAGSNRDKIVKIVVHADDGDYPLTADQIAALLV